MKTTRSATRYADMECEGTDICNNDVTVLVELETTAFGLCDLHTRELVGSMTRITSSSSTAGQPEPPK